MGLRDSIGRYLPSWLADNFPASASYGFRLLWVAAAFVDAAIEATLQGSIAATGKGTPTALRYIGEARGIIRGRHDTHDQYRAKLATWIDRHKERGSQRRLAKEIWEYLGDAPRVRVVNRAGHWVSIAPDGVITEHDVAFDWDTVSNPERNDPDNPWWSDLWVIIYPSWTFRPGTWGDLVGEDGYGLGHLAPNREIDELKRIFSEWKAAHECIRAVIWTIDPDLFDPDVPASLPDGTWGNWGTTGSGSRVAGGRDLTTCRFWEPRS